jgi:GNAT superfamily N-acetyltransferase
MEELTKSLKIRRAGAEDVPAILSLTTALAEYEKLTPPDAGAGARLSRDIAGEHPRFRAYLAEVNGQPAGYAVAFETYSTFMAEPAYYVEDIFILKEFRGKGIGRAMFAVLAEEALRCGCRRMDWTALDWNQPALDFYQGLGASLMKEWRVFRLDTAGMERLAEESQAYFQREDWQKCECKADEDVAAGRVKRFKCAADAVAHLKSRE